MLLCGHKTKSLIEPTSEDEEDLLSWEGHVKVDTYFYATIIGNLDIEEVEDVYTIEGDLRLPNGTIDLYDTLNFEVKIVLFLFNLVIMKKIFTLKSHD